MGKIKGAGLTGMLLLNIEASLTGMLLLDIEASLYSLLLNVEGANVK